jgi:lipopolysaccharide assembly outer membrane protein LptD (OstA)
VRPLVLFLSGCLVLVTVIPLTAQESDAAETEIQESLLRRTLAQDIRTAGFYELSAWLESLGLSTQGGRSDLEARLFGYYELEPSEQGTSPEGGRVLTIDSALETDYFEIEAVEEGYVRLRGGVVLTLEDQEEGAVHRIEAEEIVVNQEEQALTALGGVQYTIERADGTETFRGERLTFYLDTWEGIFIDGASRRPRTIEDEELTFTYSGSVVTRSPDDIIVMEDGVITSSEADPPNYQIRARKIWLLDVGEWGLQHAALHVGRIPVFYFPFFFRPGDKLFFHPSVGYRSREGTYIQTTTYLLGRKEETSSPISFLQIAEEGSGEVPREREGLFLRVIEEPSEEEEPDWTLKFLSDIYTTLGAHLGMDGSFVEVGLFDSLEFRSSIAASRHVYSQGAFSYSPFRVVDGEAEDDWNTAYLGSISLPLRYLFDASFLSELESGSVEGQLELFSDPFMELDFRDRGEEMDWLGLIRSGEEESIEEPETRDSQTWRIRGNYSWQLDPDTPAPESIRIENLEGRLSWLSRDVEDVFLSDSALAADRSPESEFYVPKTLTFPDLRMRITGTIFDTARSAGEDSEEESPGESPDLDLRPPWPRGGGVGEAEDAEAARIRYPDLQGDVVGIPVAPPLTQSLRYEVLPRVTVENRFDDGEWKQPEDVDYTYEVSTFTTTNTLRLLYQADFFDRYLVYDDTITLIANYRSLYNSDRMEDDDYAKEREQAFDFSRLETRNSLLLTSFFLQRKPYWDASNLSYSLDTTLYQRLFDSLDADDNPVYDDRTFRWDDDYVTAHQVDAKLRLDIWQARQSLDLSATLPPLTDEYSSTLTTITGIVTSSVSVSAVYDNREWTYNPLSSSQTIAPLGWLSFSHSEVFDIEGDEWTSFKLESVLGPLRSEYLMTKSRDYEFVDDFVFQGFSSPWQPVGADTLRPTSATVALNFDRELDPLWKNRLLLSTLVSSGLNMNLLRYTESSFDITFGLGVKIHKFLDLTFESVSENDFVYQYVPRLAEKVGREPRNLFTDLADSYSFFNRQEREESFFKLKRIAVSAVHRMGDWDLTFSYSGAPEEVIDGGDRRLEWVPQMEIVLEWKPIPEIRSQVTREDDITDYAFGSDPNP